MKVFFSIAVGIVFVLLSGCVSRFSGVDLLNNKTINPAGEDTRQVTGQGDTAIENNVVRWFIDTDPRGARIFWRIISSSPEVNSTNESYLGLSPFEETRSLDVKGLSEANAGNVQLEFRITKNGYYEMRKRFNLQAVIDQKEISAFVELARQEE